MGDFSPVCFVPGITGYVIFKDSRSETELPRILKALYRQLGELRCMRTVFVDRVILRRGL